jgi:hypothetical protein
MAVYSLSDSLNHRTLLAKTNTMMRSVCTLLLLSMLTGLASAQSTAYVFKGGLSVGTQKWDNSINRELLFAWHTALAVESVNNDNDRDAIYAQIGYHVRGSASRFRYFNFNNPQILGNQFTQKFEFRNLALQVGAKQKHPLGERSKYFYFGGLRGEYNLSTNLGELQVNTVCNPGAFPLEGGERKFMFGFSVGGGLQLDFGELVGAQIELSVHPDITPQYRQGPIPNVIDQCNPGVPVSIPERRIRNTSIELSVGLRLLRKVVYVD